jgi:hypothetical protein
VQGPEFKPQYHKKREREKEREREREIEKKDRNTIAFLGKTH